MELLPGIWQVVEGPCDSIAVPDGAPLSAFQYFENVRNFLVAVEEMGLPNFEASDLGEVRAEVKRKGKFLKMPCQFPISL